MIWKQVYRCNRIHILSALSILSLILRQLCVLFIGVPRPASWHFPHFWRCQMSIFTPKIIGAWWDWSATPFLSMRRPFKNSYTIPVLWKTELTLHSCGGERAKMTMLEWWHGYQDWQTRPELAGFYSTSSLVGGPSSRIMLTKREGSW